MADAPLTPEERDLLAAELALGVLEGDERAHALRLQMADAAFREAVVAWQARFEPLLHRLSEIEAPDLWHAIEQRLPPGTAAPIGLLRNRIRSWRTGAIAASAVAAGFATLWLLGPLPSPQPKVPEIAVRQSEPFVARLGETDAPAQLVANYDAARGELRIRALKMPASELTPELWVIPQDGTPRSLGLVAASGSTRVAVSPALQALLHDGATLAITLEQREGAPHAAPSSTPIATGQIHRI